MSKRIRVTQLKKVDDEWLQSIKDFDKFDDLIEFLKTKYETGIWQRIEVTFKNKMS